eukprot:NODE_1869_length_1374_cov_44.867925_g1690_i0.p1 GENE.NODE_1869_length_1374_cov_44.867925_g1690_i0~~NODE_1869_length_1374_cov_44.867925_g1690_i0.p1  ORF type:complete len:309 (+),score=61.31 NODE_1869_length_1374_cov_44.867925_g1690_i0:61-987(+)
MFSSSGHSDRGWMEKHFDDLAIEMEDERQVDPEVSKLIRQKLLQSADMTNPTVEDNLDDIPKQVTRRKVMRKVEVPYTQKVKVPTTDHQIVPSTQRVTVRVKKQVPREVMDEKEEAYSSFEEVPATRMREIWVKKLIPEAITKKVKVRKTRMVQVPRTVYEDEEYDEVIEVPTTKVVEVPTFRIDEVRKTKIVEVEGWQEVELVPRLRDGKVRVERTRELERRDEIIDRKLGIGHYSAEEPRLNNVDTDSDEDVSTRYASVSVGSVELDGTERRTRPPRNSPLRSHSPARLPAGTPNKATYLPWPRYV